MNREKTGSKTDNTHMQTPNAYPPIRARVTPVTPLNPTEKDIEQYFRKKCKSRGWLCLKFVSPGNDGVPDRIVLADYGVSVFVEFKKPGKKPTRMQERVHAEFRGLRHTVFVVDSFESAEMTLDTIMEKVIL